MIFLTMWMRCGQRRADPLSKTTIEEISKKAVLKKNQASTGFEPVLPNCLLVASTN